MKTTDLIICLGGGVTENGYLARHIQRRVSKSVDISNMSNDSVILFSSSFTLNKLPIFTTQQCIVSEASAMAKFAKSLGYERMLYCEQQSHDTIGSAYFTFSDFVSFLQPKTITVITSDFHIHRARAIFSHIAKLFTFKGQLIFLETASSYKEIRIQKESDALQNYRLVWQNINDISNFRYNFFRYHSNYNIDFASDLSSSTILQSY